VTRYDDLVAALSKAARPDRPAPPAFAAYLEKVRTGAYRVTDTDVEKLKTAGHSEDEIFEQTVAAAIREGMRRYDAATEAIG